MVKKADLQMSLGFIVAIVISVTLLILAINWLNSMFSNISDITDKITAQAHEELARNLQSGKSKVGLTVPTKVKQDRSKEGKFEVGIRNTDYEDRCFTFDITLADVSAGLNLASVKTRAENWFTYFAPQWVEAQGIKYKTVSTKIDSDSLPGDYLFKINVYKSESVTTPSSCASGVSGDYYDDVELIISVV